MNNDSINQLSDLDGVYSAVYQTVAPELPGLTWFDHTNAIITIENGHLSGKDDGGTSWVGKISLVKEMHTIEFDVDVDAKNAPNTTFVLDENGHPSREVQNYSGQLKVAFVQQNITLYGTVTHGVVSIEITLKRN